MIVLDGCSAAGGAGHGYVLAGHMVWGTDIAPQPNYLKCGAAGFYQVDILEVLARWMDRIEVAHVSPPCQFYSAMSRCRPDLAAKYPEMITPVRELLDAWGGLYVIENVAGAGPWMKDPMLLCAQQFRPGVLLYRHRLFEAGRGFTLAAPLAPAEGTPGRRRECG